MSYGNYTKLLTSEDEDDEEDELFFNTHARRLNGANRYAAVFQDNKSMHNNNGDSKVSTMQVFFINDLFITICVIWNP